MQTIKITCIDKSYIVEQLWAIRIIKNAWLAFGL